METFLDYDRIECVELKHAKKEYPELNWRKIEARFVWGMGVKEDIDVLTLADLNLCMKLHEIGGEIGDYDYVDIVHCSVCRKVLLPDDEAYTDYRTGDILCDRHSVFSERANGYIKIIF